MMTVKLPQSDPDLRASLLRTLAHHLSRMGFAATAENILTDRLYARAARIDAVRYAELGRSEQIRRVAGLLIEELDAVKWKD